MDVPPIWGHNSETKAQIKETKNMLTTSFGHSIRRNQHCINLRSHLGWAASFVQKQLQKYNNRDFLKSNLGYFKPLLPRPLLKTNGIKFH